MFLPFAFNLLIWIIGGYGLTNSYSFVLNVFSFDDEKICIYWFECAGWFFFRGYNIGIRLIDEFLAKSNVSRCVDFKETAEVIAKVIFCHLSSLTFKVII